MFINLLKKIATQFQHNDQLYRAIKNSLMFILFELLTKFQCNRKYGHSTVYSRSVLKCAENSVAALK